MKEQTKPDLFDDEVELAKQEVPSNMYFDYTVDENGLVKTINFVSPISSKCELKTSPSKLFSYDFSGESYLGNKCHKVDMSYYGDLKNNTKYLHHYVLSNKDISDLLIKVISKLNVRIVTIYGLSTLTKAFLHRDFNILAAYMMSSCKQQFSGLILGEGKKGNFTLLSQEAKQEMAKVVHLYSCIFGEMFALMLQPMNPYGLIIRARNAGTSSVITNTITL